MKRSAPALLLVALCACAGDEVTEILVVVDSNLSVPGELDAVRVEVDGVAMGATGQLTGSRAEPLPRTVGIVHAGGSLGPIDVRAVGLSRGAEVVERRASTHFRTGKTLVLTMYLSRSCLHTTCSGEQTCVDGSCRSAVVDPDTLPEWSGHVPRADGGSCVAVDERCNGLDDDCDGAVDEDFDLDSDLLNCGACGAVCSPDNATAACSGGTCTLTGCDAGFDDCNGDPDDGCETDLTSTEICGACGMTCELEHATATCADGACAVDACEAGFDDCNADAADGCEAALDAVEHCGACDNACAHTNATAACTDGACALEACDAGFDDCDTDDATGCEQALTTLAHCGACDTPCALDHATATCDTGTCAVESCDALFGDCNGNPADGCERSLDTLSDCGGCGAGCNPARGTGVCTAGVCSVASCEDRWGDCNTDPSDGCETNLRNSDMHCGSCGHACAAGESCGGGTCN